MKIVHNFSFIERFDHILVLNNRRIVEQNTHRTLIARRGFSCDLYRLQAADAARPQ